MRKLTTEEFIQRVSTIHGNKYDYSKVEYDGIHTDIIVICPIHGEFIVTPHNHIRQHSGCPKCYNLTRSINIRKTTKEFITKSKQIHGNKYDYSKTDYIDAHTEVCIICPEHGEFYPMPYNHTINGSSCPSCNESRGEKSVAKWLDKHKFNYDREKRFDGCRNTNPLPFDFYIPSLNILIEYDGIQHFKPVEYFGGEKAFIDRQKNDNIKTKYCKDNDIPLIRIRYDEDVVNKMNQYV